jgi:hypothetical protein
MLFHRRLACSFCGRSAAEVGKLVAGPRVYICDSCVAEAQRVMNDPKGGVSDVAATPSLWKRLVFGAADARRGGPTNAGVPCGGAVVFS